MPHDRRNMGKAPTTPRSQDVNVPSRRPPASLLAPIYTSPTSVFGCSSINHSFAKKLVAAHSHLSIVACLPSLACTHTHACVHAAGRPSRRRAGRLSRLVVRPAAGRRLIIVDVTPTVRLAAYIVSHLLVRSHGELDPMLIQIKEIDDMPSLVIY